MVREKLVQARGVVRVAYLPLLGLVLLAGALDWLTAEAVTWLAVGLTLGMFGLNLASGGGLF